MEYIEYKRDDKRVYAALVEEQDIGEVVQELYENGYNSIFVQEIKLNDLISDSPTRTTISVSKPGQPVQFIIVEQGYYVEEEDDQGVLVNVYLVPQHEFEAEYSVVN